MSALCICPLLQAVGGPIMRFGTSCSCHSAGKKSDCKVTTHASTATSAEIFDRRTDYRQTDRQIDDIITPHTVRLPACS